MTSQTLNSIPAALAIAIVLGLGGTARATIINPDPATWADDVGVETFLHGPGITSIELADPFEGAPAGTAFGFYFAADPGVLIPVFEPTDVASAGTQSALIDFSTGTVFDVDAGVAQNTFAGVGELGFWFFVPDLFPEVLYSQASLNPFGDVSASFQSLSLPIEYLIAFEHPDTAAGLPPLSFHIVTGIAGVVPVPGTLVLLSAGLLGIGVFGRRRP